MNAGWSGCGNGRVNPLVVVGGIISGGCARGAHNWMVTYVNYPATCMVPRVFVTCSAPGCGAACCCQGQWWTRSAVWVCGVRVWGRGMGSWGGPDGCDVTSYPAPLRLDFSGFHVVPWSPDFVSLGSVPVRHYVCLIDHIDMVQLS